MVSTVLLEIEHCSYMILLKYVLYNNLINFQIKDKINYIELYRLHYGHFPIKNGPQGTIEISSYCNHFLFFII